MGKELYIGGDKDDVRFRLSGTICRYKGRPGYIGDTRGASVYFQDLVNQGEGYKVIDHRDGDFDYRSPPLGYMNYGGNACYLSRIPDRDNQKMGLGQHVIDARPSLEDRRSWFVSVEMGKCILGEHPSLEEALKLLNEDEAESVAFHRHFALSKLNAKVFGIHYRGRLVGLREGEAFRLLEAQDVSFIEPILRKAGIMV